MLTPVDMTASSTRAWAGLSSPFSLCLTDAAVDLDLVLDIDIDPDPDLTRTLPSLPGPVSLQLP